MRPTVPQHIHTEEIRSKDFDPLYVGKSGEDTPYWFMRVDNTLSSLENFLDELGSPTRVSVLAHERVAGYKSESVTLPIKDAIPTEFTITKLGDNWQEGDGWGFREENAEVVLDQKGANWASIDTFGKTTVRLIAENFDSGWLETEGTREIHFPNTTSPVTIQFSSNNDWTGYSNISLGVVSYLNTYETTVEGSVESTYIPEGTGLEISYSTSPKGPWAKKLTERLQTSNHTLVPMTVVAASSLGMYIEKKIVPGSELLMGHNREILEIILADTKPLGIPGQTTTQAWDLIPDEMIYRGFIAATRYTDSKPTGVGLTMNYLPKGAKFKVSWIVEVDSEITVVPKVSGLLGSTKFNGSHATDPVHLKLIVNGTALTSKVILTPGLNEVVLLGTVMANGNYGFNVKDLPGTKYYALRVPMIQSFIKPSTGMDCGIGEPSFQVLGNELITSISAYQSRIIEGPPVLVNGLLHDPNQAKSCTLRVPSKNSYIKIVMTGGHDTPVVRVLR